MSDLYKGGPTADEILSGGAEIELEFVNRQERKFEHLRVLVGLVPVKEYPKLREAIQREAELPWVYLRRDFSRLENLELTPESHELLMDVGRRVNAHFFACWLPRQRELEELAHSGLSEELIAAAAREFVATYQQQSSPEPSATSGRGAPIAPPVGAKHWKPSAT